jgi:hypothetical protein
MNRVLIPALRKQGKLGDFFYEVRPENVLEDFIQYSQNADAALGSSWCGTRYAQLVTELNALGKQYTEVATSQMAGLGKQYDKSAINPFGDYVRTALDISKRSSFPLVHQLNEFVDSAGTAAYRILLANTESHQGTCLMARSRTIATKLRNWRRVQCGQCGDCIRSSQPSDGPQLDSRNSQQG